MLREVPVSTRPLIGSPIYFIDCLIGSPISSQSTALLEAAASAPSPPGAAYAITHLRSSAAVGPRLCRWWRRRKKRKGMALGHAGQLTRGADHAAQQRRLWHSSTRGQSRARHGRVAWLPSLLLCLHPKSKKKRIGKSAVEYFFGTLCTARRARIKPLALLKPMHAQPTVPVFRAPKRHGHVQCAMMRLL